MWQPPKKPHLIWHLFTIGGNLHGSETRAHSKWWNLCWPLPGSGNFKALTPSLISSSQQRFKVILSSSFHRWRNWDSERLSNRLSFPADTQYREAPGSLTLCSLLLLLPLLLQDHHFTLHCSLFHDTLEKKSLHFSACVFCPWKSKSDCWLLHLTQAAMVGIFSPRSTHSWTCQSSLTIILQYRNRELALTLHAPGQPHVERLRMSVFGLCLHNPNPRKLIKVSLLLCEMSGAILGLLPVSAESIPVPQKTQTGVLSHFIVKTCDSLGKSGLPGPPDVALC